MTKAMPKLPPMFSVASSSISHVGFADGTLFVRFAKGRAYSYPGVSADQYKALREAKSIGKHLQVEILRNVEGQLVKEGDD
jgi:hypothetical protein